MLLSRFLILFLRVLFTRFVSFGLWNCLCLFRDLRFFYWFFILFYLNYLRAVNIVFIKFPKLFLNFLFYHFNLTKWIKDDFVLIIFIHRFIIDLHLIIILSIHFILPNFRLSFFTFFYLMKLFFLQIYFLVIFQFI